MSLKGRVESRMSAVAWSLWPSLRFPSPLIELDVPIFGIRLSDWKKRMRYPAAGIGDIPRSGQCGCRKIDGLLPRRRARLHVGQQWRLRAHHFGESAVGADLVAPFRQRRRRTTDPNRADELVAVDEDWQRA